MGEQLRSHVAGVRRRCMLRPGVFDVFRYAQRTDPAHVPGSLGRPLECDGGAGRRHPHLPRQRRRGRPHHRGVRGARQRVCRRLQHHRARLGAARLSQGMGGETGPLRRGLGAVAFHRGQPGDRGRPQHLHRPGHRVRAGGEPAAAAFRHPRIGLCAAELLRSFVLRLAQEPRGGPGAAGPGARRHPVPRHSTRAEGEERRARGRGMGGHAQARSADQGDRRAARQLRGEAADRRLRLLRLAASRRRLRAWAGRGDGAGAAGDGHRLVGQRRFHDRGELAAGAAPAGQAEARQLPALARPELGGTGCRARL